MRCPLSKSSDVSIIDEMDALELVRLYRKKLDMDISNELMGVHKIFLCHSIKTDLRFFFPIVTGSEAFYEKMQEFKWYYLRERFEFEYIKSKISVGCDVLEVGCGNGIFGSMLSHVNYTGLEFNQIASDQANRSGVFVLKESIQNHATSHKEKYDFVCAFQVLEHVPDVHSFIDSCLMCLKPGGFLILSVPSHDSFLSVVSNNVLNLPPHHVTLWTDMSLVSIASVFDLRIVEIVHEKLEGVHQRWYIQSKMVSNIKSKFGIAHRVVDLSLAHDVVINIARIYAAGLCRYLSDIFPPPIGHTAAAIYQKL
jgi:SAM-dependent methyltransferase